MILVAAVDDNMGMAFNNRRQSQDRLLRERILDIAAGRPVWMSQYTYGQFGDCLDANIIADDDFFIKAGQGEYCIIEFPLSIPDVGRIEGVILARWNRVYPADAWFDSGLLMGMRLERKEELTGFSHDRIEIDIYKKEKRKDA